MIRAGLLLIGLLALISSSAPGQTSSQPQQTTIYVTATNAKTDLVVGLKPQFFRIYENNVEQKITSFNSAPEPMSIGFLFDFSDSIVNGASNEAINEAANNIYEFAKKQNQKNEYFLIGFNRNVVTLLDWSTNPDDLEGALNKLPSIQTKRSKTSSVYDAYFEAINKLETGKHAKKVLIAFTDGEDSSSKTTPRQLIQLAKGTSTLIYTVTLGSLHFSSAVLEALSEDSGGYVNVPPDTSSMLMAPGLGYTFERIFEELSKQYSITFIPSNPKADGKAASIDVKLNIQPAEKKEIGFVHLRFRGKYIYH